MISYEVGMGLALIAVLMYSGSLRMSEIVVEPGPGLERDPPVPRLRRST